MHLRAAVQLILLPLPSQHHIMEHQSIRLLHRIHCCRQHHCHHCQRIVLIDFTDRHLQQFRATADRYH